MIPGTVLVAPNRWHGRGTAKALLSDLTDAQVQAESEERQLALQIALSQVKENRAAIREAAQQARADQLEREAQARIERVQQQALEASQKAAEGAAYTQQGILVTGQRSLTKVLIAVGATVLASYVLFAKKYKAKPEKEPS